MSDPERDFFVLVFFCLQYVYKNNKAHAHAHAHTHTHAHRVRKFRDGSASVKASGGWLEFTFGVGREADSIQVTVTEKRII